jgi:hypothetical protein
MAIILDLFTHFMTLMQDLVTITVVTGFLKYFQKCGAALVSVCYFPKPKTMCVVRFLE